MLETNHAPVNRNSAIPRMTGLEVLDIRRGDFGAKIQTKAGVVCTRSSRSGASVS